MLAQVMAADPAELVRVVPALFLGVFLGVALSPVAARRPSLAVAVAGGAVAQAGALVLLASATTTPVATAAAAAAGVGFGLVESLGAALARLLAASHTRRTLTQLTALTAAVATVAPLTVVAAGADSARLVLAGAAVPHVLAAAALVGTGNGPAGAADATTSSAGRPASRRWIAGAVFGYVGSETMVSGWSAVIPQRHLDLTATSAAVGTSAFWLLLTLGRLAGAAMLARRADPQAVLIACQVACVALLLASAAAAGMPVLTLALLGAAVVLMGPCYALLLGVALQAVGPHDAPRTSAVLVAAGALGGTVWSAGATVRDLDSRWIITAACVAMVLSAVCARRARLLSDDRSAEPGRALQDTH